jgi:hypothetical protein
MRTDQGEVKIPPQVGSELRIKNTGEIAIINPELELMNDDAAADAVLVYRFDRQADEHVLRLYRATQVSSHVGVRLAVPFVLAWDATEPRGYGKPYPYVRTDFVCC